MAITINQARAVEDLATRLAATTAENAYVNLIDKGLAGQMARQERLAFLTVSFAACAVIDCANGVEGFDADTVEDEFWGAIDDLPCAPHFYAAIRASESFVPAMGGAA